jgi:hypothetical protein
MNDEQEKQTDKVNRKLLRTVQVILMVVTVFLLISHILKWDAIQVDSISLALVGLILLIPLADLIRKIKLGEFEAEIGKDEVANVQAQAASELPPPTKEELDISEKEVRELLRSDPRLAMAKIRIELEEALKRLYSATDESKSDLRITSLGRLVDILVQKQVLREPVAISVRDVINLANRAVHGERVESNTAEELAILGIRLIHEIHQTYLEHLLKPTESEVISEQEVDRYHNARYRVTTIVPLVKKPTKNIYIFDQEALESFIEGYEEYAEFIVGIEQI